MTVRRDGDGLSVSDDGVGIPADSLHGVFDLFTHADRSLAHSEGGLGIGLTIARKPVELRSGSVVAKSEGPGRGSVFTVRSPIIAIGPRRHALLLIGSLRSWRLTGVAQPCKFPDTDD